MLHRHKNLATQKRICRCKALTQILHRKKSHVSAFLKPDGNIEFHVSVTVKFYGNLKYQVLAILSSFRHVSGTKMSSHVSVVFKSGRFGCCSFPLCFCKLIFNILVESLQTWQRWRRRLLNLFTRSLPT